jgi:hypothetical protein
LLREHQAIVTGNVINVKRHQAALKQPALVGVTLCDLIEREGEAS